MKNSAKAKKIINKDNLESFYWIYRNKDIRREFMVMHPGSSVNHSTIELYAKYLNDLRFPILIVDPIGYGLSESSFTERRVTILPKYFTTEKYSETLEQILNVSVKLSASISYLSGWLQGIVKHMNN
jgi:hypothetical protein